MASFAYLTLATGKGPLAEIDFWRERNAALSSLFEQLNLPNVRKMIEVLETAPNVDTSVMSAFKVQFAELTKLYVETKDNVKFLTTLERHFKVGTSETVSPRHQPRFKPWLIEYNDTR